MSLTFEMLTVRKEGAVLFAEILAPPMNLLGPHLVRVLRIEDAMKRGFQTRDAEMAFAEMLGRL